MFKVFSWFSTAFCVSHLMFVTYLICINVMSVLWWICCWWWWWWWWRMFACLMSKGQQFLGRSESLSFCEQARQRTLCQQCNVRYFWVCMECRISRNTGVLPTVYWWFAWTATGLVWETVPNRHSREKAISAHLLVMLSIDQWSLSTFTVTGFFCIFSVRPCTVLCGFWCSFCWLLRVCMSVPRLLVAWRDVFKMMCNLLNFTHLFTANYFKMTAQYL